MSVSKDLDQFYTDPKIAKIFVDKINKLIPLKYFDLVIEPSAGSGNILKYLPKNSLAFDLDPKADGIVKMNWFDYKPSVTEILQDRMKIVVVGNPPFGTGYMNPLAKGFFNHAAKFADTIAFIVPAKYHSSWKVHKQLNSNFGLYFSEILPKNSFIKDGQPYDVNCCMQVWSKRKLSKNLRILKAPPTSHPDFDMFLTCDNVAGRPDARKKLKNKEYWKFGLKYWGKIEVHEIQDIPVNTTTHYLIHPFKDYVRDVFEKIDWSKYVTNMGAPNVGGKSIVVKAYMEKLKELHKKT
jgi:predicted RNA methylase